ncbi:hypothetical protein DAPPUDRAFT_236048 [Daphnia pulex]|uniref:Uncharacterized protein n=1 Tax=Daphnia pulex TaxID=6669 RepID=E9FZT4_DAPPU|nr:hypothetical protein DAPPUDRAFT_236048 [Daphnia pulex]|eukprot:EFX87107.1 hypothetical protein DAPPUDRAFT_236048 [Daphnia pulex]
MKASYFPSSRESSFCAAYFALKRRRLVTPRKFVCFAKGKQIIQVVSARIGHKSSRVGHRVSH